MNIEIYKNYDEFNKKSAVKLPYPDIDYNNHTIINWKGCYLNDNDIKNIEQNISKLLPFNTKIILLSDNIYITDKCIYSLINIIKYIISTIQYIELKNTSISTIGLNMIENILDKTNKKFKWTFWKEQYREISKTIACKNRKINVVIKNEIIPIILNYNDTPSNFILKLDKKIEEICENDFTQVSILDFSNNDIDDILVEILLIYLKHEKFSFLQEINLSSNKLTNDCISFCYDILSKQNLLFLNITSNYINIDGIISLNTYINHRFFETLGPFEKYLSEVNQIKGILSNNIIKKIIWINKDSLPNSTFIFKDLIDIHLNYFLYKK